MALVELNFFGTGWHMDTPGMYNMTLVELNFGSIIQLNMRNDCGCWVLLQRWRNIILFSCCICISEFRYRGNMDSCFIQVREMRQKLNNAAIAPC